jgi:hypothetical protein
VGRSALARRPCGFAKQIHVRIPLRAPLKFRRPTGTPNWLTLRSSVALHISAPKVPHVP